jgi:hypothetical protein
VAVESWSRYIFEFLKIEKLSALSIVPFWIVFKRVN